MAKIKMKEDRVAHDMMEMAMNVFNASPDSPDTLRVAAIMSTVGAAMQAHKIYIAVNECLMKGAHEAGDTQGGE